MHKVDLRDFLYGPLDVKGGTNLRHGMKLDASDAVPAPYELDTRVLWRYLWSDTPFIVRGRQSQDGSRNSEKVCQCK